MIKNIGFCSRAGIQLYGKAVDLAKDYQQGNLSSANPSLMLNRANNALINCANRANTYPVRQIEDIESAPYTRFNQSGDQLLDIAIQAENLTRTIESGRADMTDIHLLQQTINILGNPNQPVSVNPRFYKQ